MFAGDDYGTLALNVPDFGQGKLTFGVKKAVDEFALQQQQNLSIDWLGDWWFGTAMGQILARNGYLIK